MMLGMALLIVVCWKDWMETGYTYLVRLDMGPETDAQSFHCLLHPIAMPANDGSVEDGRGFGDVRDVLADPALEQLSLRG